MNKNYFSTSTIFDKFTNWYADAKDSYATHSLENYNAFSISTVKNGKPSSRMVLLKSVKMIENKIIFSFFTNLNSKKTSEIIENANIAMLFHWGVLKKQIRIEGTASVSGNKAEDDTYFASRSYLSKIGAWASKQSEAMENIDILLSSVDKYMLIYNSEVERPEHWGSIDIVANYVEFWEEKPHRLHIRETYTYNKANEWNFQLLYP